MSVDIERALIGACLLDPHNIDQVAGTVSGTDFTDTHLGHFWDVVATAHEACLPVGDPKLLLSELRRSRVDDSVANAGFVGRLITESTASNAKYYAEQLRDAAKLRHYQAVGHCLTQLAAEHDAKPAEVAAWLDAQVAMDDRADGDQIRTLGEIATDYVAELRRPDCRERIVMSGLPSLDETVGGWMPGELVILAARTSQGKSAFAMQMAGNVADKGKSVLFVSLEMKDRELVGRILCGRAEVNSKVVRRGQQTDDEIARIEWAAAKIHDWPLRVWADYKRKPTTSRVRANAKRVKAAAGLDLLVVDYLNLLQPSDKRRDRHEQIGQITGDLKAIAQELSIPVLALSQLNREADKGPPRLSHLRESGSIEQDADCVLFLHREDLKATQTSLIVAKHRHGETGTMPITWVPARTCFDDSPNRNNFGEEYE